MLEFPDWTNSEDTAERAKLRLRFIVHHLSLLVGSTSPLNGFAEEVGVSRASLYAAQYRGRFTRPVATAIVAKFGERTGVTMEMLTNPNFDLKTKQAQDGDN